MLITYTYVGHFYDVLRIYDDMFVIIYFLLCCILIGLYRCMILCLAKESRHDNGFFVMLDRTKQLC
jgi:hypothetical protein